MQLWDLRSNALLQHYGGSSASITSAAWHPSGNFLLTSSLDTTLKVGGEALRQIGGWVGVAGAGSWSAGREEGGGRQECGSSPSSAACRPNGNFLLTSSLDTHVEGGLVGWVVGRWKLGPGGVG